MDFSAHFLLLGGRPARHGALGDDFSGGADDFVPLWTRLRRRRSVARTGMRKCRARGQDVSGMAPPCCMMRAQRSRIAANMSNMAALIFKNICRPWRTILPLSLIHISEPTRLGMISYAVFCLKKKTTH